MRLLVVEDDREAADYLKKALREAGHLAEVAADGETGLALALDGDVDVLVVDRMLPKRDGLSLISELKAKGIATGPDPSALGQVDDRVTGPAPRRATIYLAKPYSSPSCWRVSRALARRRAPQAANTVYQRGRSRARSTAHSVVRAERTIDLQPREFRLLEYLMRHSGQVVTRTMLLEGVWDYHFDPQTNVIDVHVSRLRAKIDRGFDKALLHTVRGAGYMIRDGAR